jgi:hypothetical protein
MITENLLIALARSVSGRNGDFNDWYSNIHIRDAMRFRSALAVQRFAQAVPSGLDAALHMALYETSNARVFTEEHRDADGSSRKRVTSAFDRTYLDDFYYRPIYHRRAKRAKRAEGSLVLVQCDAGEDRCDDLVDWLLREPAPRLAANPNVEAVTVAQLDEERQILPFAPSYHAVLIARVTDIGVASRTLSAAFAKIDGGLPVTLVPSFWSPITPYLTAEDVRQPTAAALAAEENARLRMGDDFLQPLPALSA